MLERIREIGGIDVLQAVLQSINPESNKTDIEGLCLYYSNHSFRLANYGRNAIHFLELIEIVSIKNNVVKPKIDIIAYKNACNDANYIRELCIKKSLLTLKNNAALNCVFPPGAVQYDSAGGIIFINENKISHEYHFIKSVLLSLNFIERVNTYGLMKIANEYTKLFENEIALGIGAELRGRITSLDELKEKLIKQEARGGAAEEYVVGYERARLSGHPNLDMVRRISFESVDSGYDIQSFDGIRSAIYDRFIEVKSFLGKERIYWTRNEIEKAKLYGDYYYLYIVDSEQLENPKYKPKIIPNPYRLIFNEKKEYLVSVDTYLLEREGQ